MSEDHSMAFPDAESTRADSTRADSTLTTQLSLADAQQQVDTWIKQYGVRYFSELTNLAQLVEEVGELARLISRTYGEQSFKPGEAERCRIDDELADIFFVLVCLANQTGVDLAAAFRRNMQKKTNRDANRHLQNDKLHGT